MFSSCCRNGFFLSSSIDNATTKTGNLTNTFNKGIELLKNVTGYGPLGATLRTNFINEWEYSTIRTSSANVQPIFTTKTQEMSSSCHVINHLKNWSEYFNIKSQPHGFAFHNLILYDKEHTLLNEYLHLWYVCPLHNMKDWILFWKRRKLKWWKQFSCCPEKFIVEDSNESNLKIKYCVEEENHLVLEDINIHQLEEQNCAIHFKTNISHGLWSILSDSFLNNNRQWKETETPNALLLLHRRLAPIKLVFLPQENSPDQILFCDKLTQELNLVNIPAICHNETSLESRLAYHDEIGTPSRILLDNTTLTNGVFYLQDRDSGLSEPLESELLLYTLQKMYQRFKDTS